MGRAVARNTAGSGEAGMAPPCHTGKACEVASSGVGYPPSPWFRGMQTHSTKQITEVHSSCEQTKLISTFTHACTCFDNRMRAHGNFRFPRKFLKLSLNVSEKLKKLLQQVSCSLKLWHMCCELIFVPKPHPRCCGFVALLI